MPRPSKIGSSFIAKTQHLLLMKRNGDLVLVIIFFVIVGRNGVLLQRPIEYHLVKTYLPNELLMLHHFKDKRYYQHFQKCFYYIVNTKQIQFWFQGHPSSPHVCTYQFKGWVICLKMPNFSHSLLFIQHGPYLVVASSYFAKLMITLQPEAFDPHHVPTCFELEKRIVLAKWSI